MDATKGMAQSKTRDRKTLGGFGVMRTVELPETDYMLATRHLVPEPDDSPACAPVRSTSTLALILAGHYPMDCWCQPAYEREGNIVVVKHRPLRGAYEAT